MRVFGDGRQTRDFVYVGDVVGGVHRRRASSDVGGGCNIGTGRETTRARPREALGLEPHFAPERPGEVRRSCLDPPRPARRSAGRRGMGLADGLERTL